MSIDIISSAGNHVKSIVKKLQLSNEIPFMSVVSQESIHEKISKLEYRDRVFSPDLTIFGFLSQVMGTDQSCQMAAAQVIAHLTRCGKKAPSANTAAYCKARIRLPEEVLSELAKESAQALDKQAKGSWLWRNRPIKIPDGTTLSMPDTPANQAIYPQPRSQKKGVGFPIVRMVGVFSLAMGVLLDLAIAPWSGKGTGEHTLLRQLMHVFEAGDIVLGDAYYALFFLIATLMKMKVDAIFPVNSNRSTDFRCGNRLGKGDHLVQWKKPAKPEWMDNKTYADFPKTITVRETKISTDRPGFHDKLLAVVTTFIDSKKVSQKDLAELYFYRWFVELNFRSVKEVMRMDILRGKTPGMVRKEIWAHVLAYNLVRKIMAQAAMIHEKRPRNLSFKLALQMISAFRQAGILSENNTQAYSVFLGAIAYKKTGNQLRNNEPHMIKRRPKSFPRLQKPRNFYQRVAA